MTGIKDVNTKHHLVGSCEITSWLVGRVVLYNRIVSVLGLKVVIWVIMKNHFGIHSCAVQSDEKNCDKVLKSLYVYLHLSVIKFDS